MCLRRLYHHILLIVSCFIFSRKSWVFVSITTVQSMVYANNRLHYGSMVVVDCLFITPSRYNHYAELSEIIEHRICLSVIFCQLIPKISKDKNDKYEQLQCAKKLSSRSTHWPLGDADVTLTHWDRGGIIIVISQPTFSNAFSRMSMLEFRLKFHWSLFLRVQLTTFQNWFR